MKITKKQLRKIIRERFSFDDFQDVYATARMAHTGQKRRSGEDYFSHPSEVRNIVTKFYPKDRVSQLAALLHDSLEDAPGSTVESAEEMEEFIRGSISDPAAADEVIRVVRALTHEKGGNYLSYVVSLMDDQPALRVKLADMVHNLGSNPSPKQRTKYKTALDVLKSETGGPPPRGISNEHWSQLFSLTEGSLLREYIRELLTEKARVLGYIKPSSSFRTLYQWELVVNEILELQKQGIDTRGGLKENERLVQIIDEYFGFQYYTEVQRYDLLTSKNVLDFVEDFANHRFWGFQKEFGGYFPNIEKLKFAYFYSRGDMEPYVLLDEEFTTQIYGGMDNQKKLSHYTTEAGAKRIQAGIDSGRPFDISCFTVAERPFFRPESNLVVELIGNVRGGFRSDIKSVAVDTGRRACNMYRLEYPGRDQDNICRELDSCDGEVRTSLWNEYIATQEKILSIRKV